MVRKLGVAFWPKDHVEAACGLMDAVESMWHEDEGWEDLGERARALVEGLASRTAVIDAVLKELLGEEVVEAELDDRQAMAFAEGIVGGEVKLDLRDLFRAPEGESVGGWVLRLVKELEGLEDYWVDFRVGGRDAEGVDFERELLVAAGLRGLRLDPDVQVDVDFGDEWEDEVWEEGDEVGEWAQGISDAAQRFLEMAGLEMPVGEAELKRAFRRVAFAYHPDRNPGDRGALERFLACEQGFQELIELV